MMPTKDVDRIREKPQRKRGSVSAANSKTNDVSPLPAASLQIDTRRGRRSPARDFQDIAEQQAKLQLQYNALHLEFLDLQASYKQVQAQRKEDRSRLTTVTRACRALEARMRTAQIAATENPATTARSELSFHKLTEEHSAGETTLPRMQTASGSSSRSMVERAHELLSLRLARLASRQRLWEKAEIFYNVVLLYRDDPAIWGQLGNMLREQEKYVTAIAAYREAMVRDPQNGEYQFLLGLSEAGRGNERAAISAYRQALKINPGLRSRFRELRDVA